MSFNDMTIEKWHKILNPRCIICRKVLPVSWGDWKCEECKND